MRFMHDMMEVGVTFTKIHSAPAEYQSLYNRWIAAHCSQLRCLDNGSLRGLQEIA